MFLFLQSLLIFFLSITQKQITMSLTSREYCLNMPELYLGGHKALRLLREDSVANDPLNRMRCLAFIILWLVRREWGSLLQWEYFVKNLSIMRRALFGGSKISTEHLSCRSFILLLLLEQDDHGTWYLEKLNIQWYLPQNYKTHLCLV